MPPPCDNFRMADPTPNKLWRVGFILNINITLGKYFDFTTLQFDLYSNEIHNFTE